MTTHKAIREALEAGPTEGPYQVVRGGTYCYDIKTTDGYDIATTHGFVREKVDSLPMANYIAACNPAAIRALLADLDAKTNALERIASIKNQIFGHDWAEIEDAREIASAALKGTP